MKWVGGIKIKGVEKKRRFDKLSDAVEYRKTLEELYIEPLLEQSHSKQKRPAVPDDELRKEREKAGVTRKTVHDRTGLSIITLRDWEYGYQHPQSEARRLLIEWYRDGGPTLPVLGVSSDKPDGDYLTRLMTVSDNKEWRSKDAGKQKKSQCKMGKRELRADLFPRPEGHEGHD